MSFFSLLAGFIPTAFAANTPKLNQWGSSNSAIQDMWTQIEQTVHINIISADVVEAITGGLVNLIFTFIAGAATLLIMYAGIRMIVARGKDDEFTQGKTIITYALIGLVLAMLARVVILFFQNGFLPAFLR